MTLFIVVIIYLICLAVGIDIYCNRHPLSSEEVLILAEKRRRNWALSDHKYSMLPRTVDPETKKGMNSNGQFVHCNIVLNGVRAFLSPHLSTPFIQ
jgi:hypothetical protein